jgi:NADPH2:quinone reductase
VQVIRSTVVDAPVDDVWRILRDFNSHALWHPAVTESLIEGDRPPDEVGCVRRFRLRSGETLREQLLSLSDHEHRLTYAILDSPIPLVGYVATVSLRPVTDGRRTFWDWRGSLATPPGRAAELARLVGEDVYEAGFAGLRAYLGRGAPVPARRPAPGRATVRGEAVVVRSFGGPEVLRLEPVEAPPPGPGEIRVRHTAVGVNFLDVYARTGLYPLIAPPGTPGAEAAGEVLDVGDGVTHVLPGDRVAYAGLPLGAYATVRTLHADQVVPLPPEIADETAAALMLKGLTAEYLLHRVRRVRRGDVVLVHAAAGGTGHLLCQWARHLGATVIGTASTADKARLAREAGCDHVLVAPGEQIAERVREATGGRGADVVYDGVGGDTLARSLDALALRGHLVSFGQASGPIGPFDPDVLASKSATVSRPVLFHYTAEPALLREMSRRVFGAVARGILRPVVGQRYPLVASAEAHRDLEARRTTGAIVLIP